MDEAGRSFLASLPMRDGVRRDAEVAREDALAHALLGAERLNVVGGDGRERDEASLVHVGEAFIRDDAGGVQILGGLVDLGHCRTPVEPHQIVAGGRRGDGGF